MLKKSNPDLISYFTFSGLYTAFIYLLSEIFLRGILYRQCSLLIAGNDWGSYLDTTYLLSKLDIIPSILAVQARMGNVDPGYWLSIFFIARSFDPEYCAPILYASVVASSFFLARPLLKASHLLIFIIFATASYSFAQNLILLPRQFCSYFLFEIAIYCFLTSGKNLFHPRLLLLMILSIAFHWSALFLLCIFLLPPVLVRFTLKPKYKSLLLAAVLLLFAGLILFSLLRFNIAYKVFIYLIANTKHDTSRGLLSFFVPFLLIASLRLFVVPKLLIGTVNEYLSLKRIANWILLASLSIYAFFVWSQSLGITRLTLLMYAIVIPFASYAFLRSSQKWRQLILLAYLLVFAVLDVPRILQFVSYMSC